MSRSDWSFPHPLHSSPDLYNHYSLRKAVRTALRAVEFRCANRTRSAKDYYATFSMTSYNRCQKGVTTNHYDGTDSMEAFVLRWLFNDYYFLVQLLAAALKKASNNRVESSYHYHNTNLHDVTIPKIPHFIYRLSTRFLLPSSGQHQITSPVDR